MNAKNRTISLTVTADAVALLLVYLIPTMAHFAPFPLYLADPMRIVILGTLLVTRNWKNAVMMALTVPLFSFMVSAHPVFPKCFLIAGELAVNVLLFAWMSKGLSRNVAVSAFASIVFSKILYYCVATLVIAGGAFAFAEFGIQVLVAAALSFLFGYIVSRR